MVRNSRYLATIVASLLVALGCGGRTDDRAGESSLAQRLVDELANRHPELVRIGLHVTPPGRSDNIIIASNVAAKINQPSDPEDLEAMKNGGVVVLKEGENFDVTLPLHDVEGQTIGAIGLTLTPTAGGQEDATRRARSVAVELEQRIPSKESLFSKH